MATQTVTVTLNPCIMNGQLSWNMTIGNNTAGPPNYLPIVVDPSNDAEITFNIQANGWGITFASSPILVPPGVSDIHKPSVQTASQLTFKDGNKKQADIPYVLMFDNAPVLDPIINNGGGGPGKSARAAKSAKASKRRR